MNSDHNTGTLQPSNSFNPSSFSHPPNPTSYNLESIWPNSPNPEPVPATKNPKKRTRASRRAPTTVLTTDTTNFRQMVQEFTGISNIPAGLTRRSDISGAGASSVNLLRPMYLNSDFIMPPSETHGFTKQPLDLSSLSNLANLQNQVGQFNQEMNVTGSENQLMENSNGLMGSSLKRWRGEDENLMSFEGVNGNNQNEVGLIRSDGDQFPGNEDWTFKC